MWKKPVGVWAWGAAAILSAGTRAEPLEVIIDQAARQQTQAIASQDEVARLDDERAELFGEYRAALRQADNLERYNAQLRQLNAEQQRLLDSLRGREAEIERVRLELMPLAERMLAALERFVGLDLPFLRKERDARLARLTKLMNGPGASVTQWYRQLIEAYLVESEYGRTVEVYRGRLIGADGVNPGPSSDAEVVVDYLRLGRVGLYYLSPDGKQGGVWEADAARWRSLTAGQRRTVAQAQRAVQAGSRGEMLILPLSPAGVGS